VRARPVLWAGAAAAAGALAAAGGAGAAPSLDDARLGPDGLGPVRIGMTVPQARAATSTRLRITQRNGDCAVNTFARTTKGIRLASPEQQVRRAYGRPFFVARDANSGGRELVYRPRPVAAPARRYAFIVASLGGSRARFVSEMSVGEVPEVRYSEACS